MPSERRLAAILFTDIVGYTALMAESEERGLAARRRHRELVRPLVGVFNGESIEARGDESLSTFPSALEAVNCALAIEDALQGEPGLRLHIGIHLGDIVLDQGEVSGDGVNVASRICALSEGGGICVSGEVYQAIRNHPEIEATPLGERDLKNVGRPVHVYSIARAEAAPKLAARGTERSTSARTIVLGAAAASAVLLAALAAWFWTSEPPPLEPIRSIAVLPLENLSGDPEQEYFADGVTDSLIADLARVSSLRVISRTSVMRYKDTRKSMPEIAAELGVQGVVEGSVQRVGDRVRIIAQLIHAPTDAHLWAEEYDRDLKGILALQSEIAAVIARQINARLTPEQERRFSTRPPADPAAHDEYLKGLYFAQKHTPAASLRARDHFNEGMRIDPDYPLSYAGLADTLSCSPLHTWAVPAEGAAALPQAVMDQALELATRAIELDPDLPEAQTARGLVDIFRHLDWRAAEHRFQQAIELNPSYEFAYRAYALQLAYQGRFEEAVTKIERARELNPFSAFVASLAGDVYWFSGDTETALAMWGESTELDAGHPLGLQGAGVALCQLGQSEEAVRLLERARLLSADDPLVVGDLAYCYATSGRKNEARVLLRDLEDRSAAAWVSPIGLALVHLGLGEREAALDQLERAHEIRTYRLLEIGVDNRWDPVRDDPRFNQVLRQVGLATGLG